MEGRGGAGGGLRGGGGNPIASSPDFLRPGFYEVPDRAVVFLAPAGPLVCGGVATIKRLPAVLSQHLTPYIPHFICTGVDLAASRPSRPLFLLLITFCR